MLETDVAELDGLYAVNVRGIYLTCQESRRMVPARRGAIVTAASTLAIVGGAPRARRRRGAVALRRRSRADR